MKTKSILTSLFLFLLLSGVSAKNVKVVFSVEMDCEKCQKKIEKNIAFEKGVKAILVKLPEDKVEVTYDDAKTDVAKLQKGFDKIGYKAVELVDKACCSGKSDAECCKSKDKSTGKCSGTCQDAKHSVSDKK